MKSRQVSTRTPERGRLMLAVAGLLFIPMSAFGVWQLFFVQPRPQGFFPWVGRILLDELAIGWLLFFSLGFLWAITGNRRMKGLLDGVAVKLAWFVFPLGILGVAVVAAALCCIAFL